MSELSSSPQEDFELAQSRKAFKHTLGTFVLGGAAYLVDKYVPGDSKEIISHGGSPSEIAKTVAEGVLLAGFFVESAIGFSISADQLFRAQARMRLPPRDDKGFRA